MARARNIKPGFCTNENLAECSFEARLCFALLPMLADREGRLEDRPKRIKGELFRFDSLDVEPLLAALEAHGFIARYEVNGLRLIQILAFGKHQNPHHREAESTLPTHPSLRLDADGKYVKPEAEASCNDVKAQGKPEARPRLAPPKDDLARGPSRADSGFWIPDSGFLIPDSSTPHTPQGGKRPRRSATAGIDSMPGFPVFYTAYPRKTGKAAAMKAWLKLAPDAVLQATILGALAAQKPHLDTRENGRFIPHAATWLNNARWEDEIPGGRKPAPLEADGRVWWQAAGFDHPGEAANARCHVGNYLEFRDGKRMQQGGLA